MSKYSKTAIIAAALAAGLAGGSAVYAQSTPNSGEGTMKQGQHGGMMNMMSQMNQMMKTCNNMMKDSDKDQKPDAHKGMMKPEQKP